MTSWRERVSSVRQAAFARRADEEWAPLEEGDWERLDAWDHAEAQAAVWAMGCALARLSTTSLGQMDPAELDDLVRAAAEEAARRGYPRPGGPYRSQVAVITRGGAREHVEAVASALRRRREVSNGC